MSSLSPHASFQSRRRWLRWEIGVTLLLKLSVLIIFWHFFFGPEHRLNPTPHDVEAFILTPPATSSPMLNND